MSEKFHLRLSAEGVRTVAFGSLTSSYADIGAATTHPIRIIMVKNTTDVSITVSADDGTKDWFDIPAGGADVLDVTTNGLDAGWFLPVGSQFQVKDQGTGATEGKVIIQCFYGV